MNKNVELALLAGASYESSRANINKILVPEGWASLNIAYWPYGSQSWPETNVPGRVYRQKKGGRTPCSAASFFASPRHAAGTVYLNAAGPTPP